MCIKSSISGLQWETTETCNSINDLAFALRKFMTKITMGTLNRLQNGRNNDQSSVSPTKVTLNYQNKLEENKKVFNVWIETWLQSQTKY